MAMNFLYSFHVKQLVELKFFFLVAKNSEPHIYLQKIEYPCFCAVPRNPVARILFEIFRSSSIFKKNNIDVIYSYFGFGIYNRKIPQISGSADSNIYFPEIDFWKEFSGFARLKKALIDRYRIWGIKRSNAVVFENSALELRARELFGIKKSTVITPSINFNFKSIPLSIPVECNKIPKGLFLCGWHPNKNFMIIPKLAYELKKRGVTFHFLITAPLDDSTQHRQFMIDVSKYEVRNMVSVIGQVKKEQLQSLYEQIDMVFLLSRLESFSNNIIESWYFKKPLIITDATWSRSICGEDSAIYVERNSVVDIVDKIILLLSDSNHNKKVVLNGFEKIKEYPSIEERINEELDFLRYVHQSI